MPEHPALFLCLGCGAALGPGCPQDVSCCTPSHPLHPGRGRMGPGCPCTARRGSASTHCLHRWLYEGISRQKAEELLLRPGNHSGSFLIRESQTRRGESPWAPSPVPPPSHPHWGAEGMSRALVGMLLHCLHLVARACPTQQFPGAAAPCFKLSFCHKRQKPPAGFLQLLVKQRSEKAQLLK